MINNSNYYTAQGWMVNDLQLQGDELAVFAILWGFSQDSKTESRTPLQYIVDWLGCDKRTALRIVAKLEMKGYIERNRQAGCVTAYKVVTKLHQCQNVTSDKIAPVVVTDLHRSSDKMSPASINNNINNNNAVKTRTPARDEHFLIENAKNPNTPTFIQWWDLYGQGHLYSPVECNIFWNTNMSDEDRCRAYAHTAWYKKTCKNMLKPYFYLCQYQKWRAGVPQGNDVKDPLFLTGKQQDECKKNGVQMVQVIWNGTYQIMTKEDAEKLNMHITRQW